MTCVARIRLAAVLVALSVPVGLSAQNARPDSHTVRPGDTLWDLARTYLGDPFLWPEIYRLNTTVVEDPHWIYPGEVLRLSGGADVSAVPQTDTPLPPVEAAAGADTTQPGQMAQAEQPPAAEEPPAAADTDSAAAGLNEPQVADLTDDNTPDARDSVDLTPLVGDHRRVANTGPSLERALQRSYRPIRRTEFYSSGFLTEGHALPFGTVLGLITPLQIEEVSSRTTAQMYSAVAVTPPSGAKYQVGDTLLAVWISDQTQDYGTVIVPTGLLRVTDVSRPENQAEVIAAFGAIRDHQSVLPAEKFTDPGNVRPVPISDGVKARVIRHRDDRELTDPQAVIFLDRGRKDGVALGDLFELRQAPRARVGAATVVNEAMATVQVVHVGERTATARVVKLIQPNIPAGTEARQIAKLPS
jgi:nucleoid-associated protein YgaU